MDRVLQMEPNNYQAKQLKKLITKKIRRGTSLVSSPRLLPGFSPAPPRLLLPEAKAEGEAWEVGLAVESVCVCVYLVGGGDYV